MKFKYFTHEEIADKETGEARLAVGFGETIDALRGEFGLPVHPTSWCRSADRNRAIGGHPRSLHVYDNPYHPTGGNCALDVSVVNYQFSDILRFIELARQLGLSVGYNPFKRFIHLDSRTMVVNLPQHIWEYKQQKEASYVST